MTDEQKPAAYMHNLDPKRIVSADTMEAAIKDGGAMLSSLLHYTIPLWEDIDGEVVVTWDESMSRILAVTRQDSDGRIISVIAEVPSAVPVSAEPVAHAMEAIMGYRLEFKPGEYCYYTPEGYALEAYKGDAPAHALYANPQPGCPSEVEVYKGWCWVRQKYNSGNIVDETFRPLFLGPQLGVPGAVQAQTSGDRAMLESLMRSFDMEMWNCPNCTATEETKDCDSAIMLREYLANNPVTVQAQQPVSGADGIAWPTHDCLFESTNDVSGFIDQEPAYRAATVRLIVERSVRAALAQQDADPLQGAADWLVKHCAVSDSFELASRLSIGYNRASRLLDSARKEQE